MNSCSRRLLAVACVATALLWARPARALSVHAVYRAACDRLLGVIMRVDRREVHLLTLEGQVVTVPRHEIVSLAFYPVSSFPVSWIVTGESLRPLRVRALVHGRVVDLVEGWPLDYSEQKVSFLQRDGKELVVSRDSIWALGFVDAGGAAPAAPPRRQDVYVHPQASGFCGEGAAAPDALRVFPQQFLNDEVVIKHEFDRLQRGHVEILEYEDDQKFYAVPQLYGNRTRLGLWLPVGSRAGASERRSNVAPLLVDELSLGPFRYQHVFVTGSAPNDLLLHDEPQTQIFYRFKAAYFHASVFFDPALLLLGSRYEWRADDFQNTTADDRLTESFAVELGFDLGPLALQIMPIAVGHGAVKAGTQFTRPAVANLLRVGPRLTFRRFEIEVLGGFSSLGAGEGDEPGPGGVGLGGVSYRYFRLNLAAQVHPRVRGRASTIVRATSTGTSIYEAFDLSQALRVAVALGHRYSIEGYAALEVQRTTQAGIEATNFFPKAGLSAVFTF